MKECSKCHRVLEDSCFYKKEGTPDGLQYVCKDCQKEYVRERSKKRKRIGVGNPALADFTPRQLIEELRTRGYKGELTYVHVIKI